MRRVSAPSAAKDELGDRACFEAQRRSEFRKARRKMAANSKGVGNGFSGNEEGVPRGEKLCPVCRAPMRVEAGRGVSVDVCPDHGVWIDQEKLASFCSYVREGEVAEASKEQSSEEQTIVEGDTGLRCPGCGYNLTGLNTATCPECGQRFMVGKAGMPPPLQPKALLVLTSSMICPVCGYPNTVFMPRECRKCGRRFSLVERIFGVGFLKPRR